MARSRHNKPPGQRNMITAKPIYMQALLDHGLSYEQVAEKIGSTSTTIRECIAAGETRKSNEMACQLIVEQLTGKREPEKELMSLDVLFNELAYHFQDKTVFELTEDDIAILNKPLRQILKDRV